MLPNHFFLRVYELQFLLMTRKSCPSHVIVGLLSFDGWVLYDDLKTDYEDFNPESADFQEDFIILLAGYVNIPQDGMCFIVMACLFVCVLCVFLTRFLF